MTNHTLAQDYFKRAIIRLQALYTLRNEKGYADVVRESQELVEIALKALLRKIGVEPPHWHDVSSILEENKKKLPVSIATELKKIIEISKRLRKERELSFYGAEDYLPTEEYGRQDADICIQDVEWLLQLLKPIFRKK